MNGLVGKSTIRIREEQKTCQVPRKVKPSKKINIGNINQSRCQKCLKDFCGSKAKSNAKKHKIYCQNIECSCMSAYIGQHYPSCTNRKCSKHGQFKCTEEGCSLQLYRIPKIRFARTTAMTHQARSQQRLSQEATSR